jgi:hypothetical protein
MEFRAKTDSWLNTYVGKRYTHHRKISNILKRPGLFPKI